MFGEFLNILYFSSSDSLLGLIFKDFADWDKELICREKDFKTFPILIHFSWNSLFEVASIFQEFFCSLCIHAALLETLWE